MSANNINTLGVWLMIGLVGALAWVAIAQDAARLWAYVIAMGFMPASVLALSIIGRVTDQGKKSVTAYRLLRVSLIGAGAILASSLMFNITNNAGFVIEGVNAEMFTWVIIAIWWAVFSIIIYRSKDRTGCGPASE